MNSKYNHKKIKQSISGNLRKYEAIAISMAISFEIEDFIKKQGISKKELAKAAGVSLSYLSQVFAGDKLFNLTMLAGISQKYQVKFYFNIIKDYFGVTVSNEGILMDHLSKKYLTSEEARTIIKKHGYPFYTPQWEVLSGFNSESQDLFDLFGMTPNQIQNFCKKVIENKENPAIALKKINDFLPIYFNVTPVISPYKEDIKTPYIKIIDTSGNIKVSIDYF